MNVADLEYKAFKKASIPLLSEMNLATHHTQRSQSYSTVAAP